MLVPLLSACVAACGTTDDSPQGSESAAATGATNDASSDTEASDTDGGSSGSAETDAESTSSTDTNATETDSSETDSGSTDDTSDTGTPDVPLIQDVLGCEPVYDYRLPPGDELHRVTLSDPSAVCNDGSPAVLFVRAATDASLADRWIFHLQGGGYCAEHDCADRWCENASNMSSLNAPEAVEADGIFSPANANSFGGANQVYLAYCSSDNHAGTAGVSVIPANADHDAFSMHFQGDAIVEAAASAIEAGVSSDDGQETLPALASGDSILLTGSSAGCSGLAHQADRLATRWATLGASTDAACDAAFVPEVEDFENEMAQAYAVMLEQGLEASYEIRMQTQVLRLDDSCVAAEQAEPFRCSIAGRELAQYVTEPRLFISQDNHDSLFVNRIIEATGGMATPALVKMLLGPASRNALARASDGTGGTEISVYGRTCNQHVSITDNDKFLNQSVPTANGPLTYHDALVDWVGGMTVIAIDSEDNLSTCD